MFARWVEEEPTGRNRFQAMEEASADDGRCLGVFYQEARPTYGDEWRATAELAKSQPIGIRQLDAIAALIPKWRQGVQAER